ncbi:MAG: LysR family transcriptional regulator substrate-binding protein [Deltaproteobacteria bacterium]|nr:LysR family transcriptional regulator substrate-binding protein [Deltaproteobacteria bacterium]
MFFKIHAFQNPCFSKSQLEREVRRRKRITKLGLATQCYTAYHWLPPLVSSFRNVHPEVRVTLHLPSTRMPIEAVREGELDLGLVHTLPSDMDGLSAVRLFDDAFVLVTAKDHPVWGKWQGDVEPGALFEGAVASLRSSQCSAGRTGASTFW